MTIKYDKHVADYIDRLSETGHVYHTKYQKKSVTFHHNAGKLTFDDVLRVWTFNKASAHFDSNEFGNIAQFVNADEYAWAVGSTEGNKETISIELCNASGPPEWKVNEDTWKAGARLAGWLFVHVIKEAPTHRNVLLHDHWSATACPGPYVHSIYNQILTEVQRWYRHFHEEHQKSTEEKSDPTHEADHKKELTKDEKVISGIQELLGIHPDGKWGPITDQAVLTFRKHHLNKF